MLFLDFSKAFDSIDRSKMKEILSAYGIPSETVNAIMILYDNTEAFVRSPDGDTEYFNINAGVLQGDTLAPYLFIIVLDYVLHIALDSHKDLGFTLKKAQSRRYPAQMITDADYADDLAVLSDRITHAEALLRFVEKTAASVGLHLNASKTKFMAFNTSGTIHTENGNKIDQVSDFTYLGSKLNSTESDVKTRIGSSWSALNKFDTIWKSQLNTKLKLQFFKTTVENVLLYGSQSWTLTKQLENKLNGAYTRLLRAALNVHWSQRVPNKTLYHGHPHISDIIRTRRLQLAGHVWRHDDEIANQLLFWQPTHGKNKRGRPSKTFINQLCDDTDLDVPEIKNLMLDRELWKSFIHGIPKRFDQ